MKAPHLVLFFTSGQSLAAWDRAGILERELALYRALRPHLSRLTFVTYGDRRDLGYRDRIDGLRVVCNRWRLPGAWYLRLVRLFHAVTWRGSVVLKSNQTPGARVPLAIARKYGLPFVARCGYLHSRFQEQAHGADSTEAVRARSLERDVFRGATRVMVTTPAMAKTVVERYRVDTERVVVVPNYVDTARFRPQPEREIPDRVLTVGRFEEQKRPLLLIEAMEGLDAELVMVGRGPLEEDVAREAERRRVRLHMPGVFPHERLPVVFCSAAIFVLASAYEGHPKALIEAMACGLAVVGTDVEGIRDVVRDGETGLLAAPDAASIRARIRELLADPAQARRLGAAARAYAVDDFGIDRVVEDELEVLRRVRGASALPRTATDRRMAGAGN